MSAAYVSDHPALAAFDLVVGVLPATYGPSAVEITEIDLKADRFVTTRADVIGWAVTGGADVHPIVVLPSPDAEDRFVVTLVNEPYNWTPLP